MANELDDRRWRLYHYCIQGNLGNFYSGTIFFQNLIESRQDYNNFIQAVLAKTKMLDKEELKAVISISKIS